MIRKRFFLSADGKVTSDQMITLRKSEVDKLLEEVNGLRAALLKIGEELPADEFIEDHDPIAASTFKRLKKVVRAAIDAARKEQP